MSLDQIAFILENCHAAKYSVTPYGRVIEFRPEDGDNWQQIEVEKSVYAMLERKYPAIINKWIVEDES